MEKGCPCSTISAALAATDLSRLHVRKTIPKAESVRNARVRAPKFRFPDFEWVAGGTFARAAATTVVILR